MRWRCCSTATPSSPRSDGGCARARRRRARDRRRGPGRDRQVEPPGRRRAGARDDAGGRAARTLQPARAGGGWGTARQLFEPLRPRRLGGADRGGGGARRARAGPERPSRPGGDAMHAAARGLVWLASNLAERAPALLVVDDVHWGDAPSLRWLALLAPRSRSCRSACCARCAPVSRRGRRNCWPSCWPRPGAAGAPAPARPVRHRGARARALPAASPAFAHACHSATGGNPFLLGALLAQLAADGVAPDEAAAARLSAFGPEQVARWVERQLARLPDGAGALARAIAILGSGAPLRHARARAGSTCARLARRRRAARGGLLEEDGESRARAPADRRRALREPPRGRARLVTPRRAAARRRGRRPGTRRAAPAAHRACTARGDRRRLARAAARDRDAGRPQSAAAYLRRALADRRRRRPPRPRSGSSSASRWPRTCSPTPTTCCTRPSARRLARAARAIALRGARALGLIGQFERAATLCRRGLDSSRASPPSSGNGSRRSS